jgi:hypothetical protein
VQAGYASDKAGELECTGTELGRYVELCCLGNPGPIELLWLDAARVARRGGWVHAEWPWSELVALRAAFTTRASLAQYVGCVKNHLHKAGVFAAELACAVGGAGQAVGEGEGEGGKGGEGGEGGKGGEGKGEEAGGGGGGSEAELARRKFSKAMYHCLHKSFEAARLARAEPLHVELVS